MFERQRSQRHDHVRIFELSQDSSCLPLAHTKPAAQRTHRGVGTPDLWAMQRGEMYYRQLGTR
jgi:hypothetical protein